MSIGSLALSTTAIVGIVAGVGISISNLSSSSISNIPITNNESTNLKRVYEIKNNGDIEDQEVKDFLKEIYETINRLTDRFKKVQEQNLMNEIISKQYWNIFDKIEKLRKYDNVNENKKELKKFEKEVNDIFDLLEKN